MGSQVRKVDALIGQVAARQHGVVTNAQLRHAGITPRIVQRRLERGSLIAIHRGIYRVGHAAPTAEATYLAAVLAGGPGALLCGRAAAYVHRLVRGAKRPPPEVLTLTERRIPGVQTHRTRVIHPSERTANRGIPLTTVALTLIDLAATTSEYELAQMCHQAGVIHETTPRQVREALKLRPRSAGASKLRAILDGDTKVALSRLEFRFLRLLKEAGLPLPVTNRHAGGRRVDCRWPEHRLTVELDSYRYHSSRHAWELDRRRERAAYARGDQHRRYTHDDVMENPRLMLGELRGLLRRRRSG